MPQHIGGGNWIHEFGKPAIFHLLIYDYDFPQPLQTPGVVSNGVGIYCSCGVPVRCLYADAALGLSALGRITQPHEIETPRCRYSATLSLPPFSNSSLLVRNRLSTTRPRHPHKILDPKGRLLRPHTQNIEGLEERAGFLGSSSQEAMSPTPSKAKGRPRQNQRSRTFGTSSLTGTSTTYGTRYTPPTTPVQHHIWRCSTKGFLPVVLTVLCVVSGLII